MSTDDTTRVARAYFEAWSERRGADALVVGDLAAFQVFMAAG